MKVISLLLHESNAELRTSVITMISSKYTGYNYFISQYTGVRRSLQILNKFQFEFLLMCSRFCPNCVEILLYSYKRDLAYCLQTVVKGGVMKQRFQFRFAFIRSWYGGVAWCAREKKRPTTGYRSPR